MREAIQQGKARTRNALRHVWIVLLEAVGGFLRNDDLRQASSLAFAAMLALIPAMLLLTYLLGLGVGSSKVAMQKVTDFVSAIIPQYGEVILREVKNLAQHKRSAGLLNLAALLWAVTPLVAYTRRVFDAIFRVTPQRSFWTTKALDFIMAMVFIMGIALAAGTSVIFRYLKVLAIDLTPPPGLRFTVPFLATVLLLLLMYGVFTPRTRKRYLLAGALATTLLWFLLRPAFSLFLTYNPGYGVAFGSLKSIFVIIIWIFYSQAAFLFGAEVVATLHRQETILIHRLMQGHRSLPILGRRHLQVQVPAGNVFFREGETSVEMYHLIQGSASIRKGSKELAVIGPGSFFGEMSFLLGLPRSATAVAREQCECLVIHEDNIDTLTREFPGLLRGMLTEMARRLRDTSEHGIGVASEAQFEALDPTEVSPVDGKP